MPHRDSTAQITRTLDDMLDTLRARPGREADLSRWRWQLRQRLAGVRDLLTDDAMTRDGWLAARAASTHRERGTLLSRVTALGPRVLEDADVDSLVDDITRLVGEIDRHFQRVNDLVYDEVELELGGSE